jgi:hypothetical protein
VLDSDTCDFGAVYLDEDNDRTFEIRNEGTADLEIGKIYSSCGCASVELSRNRVPPGEAAELTVRVGARGAARKLDKELRIDTNDPQHPELVLRFLADVRDNYRFDPPVLDFGDLILGERATRTVQVFVAEPQGRVVEEVIAEDPRLTAELVPADGEAAFALAVTLCAADTLGPVLRQVKLRTDHPRQPLAIVTVQGVLKSDLVIEPSDEIDFGEIDRATGAEATVTISRTDPDRPLVLEKVDLVCNLDREAADRSLVETEIEPLIEHRRYRITVKILPGATQNSIFGRLDLATADSELPLRSLAVKGVFR